MVIADVIGLVSLMAASYVATNLDNLLLLVLLLGAHPESKGATLCGHLVAAGGVLVLCLAAVIAGTIIDPGLLGYLGIIPIVLGLRLLYRQFAARGEPSSNTGIETRSGWLATALLLAGNSGDTLAVFLPLFAESDLRYIGVAVALFVVMAVAWGALALGVSSNLARARRLVRLGEYLVPWVMLAAGSYVLLDTATDSLI